MDYGIAKSVQSEESVAEESPRVRGSEGQRRSNECKSDGKRTLFRENARK